MRPSSSQAASTEKKRYGIPHRIYRGRIVDALRGKTWLTAHRIGEIVLPGYTPADEGWLQQLLEGLRRDGLIVVHLVSGRCRVALA